jgi:FAD/FMN-containing dehydrogenase
MSSSIERLREQLDQSEVHLPCTAGYLAQSLPWSQHADAKPKLVITPSTLPSLQACVKLLYADESLDFAVRNTGTGSASARDVILSMHGFKSFSFDAVNEIVSIGAGLDWTEIEVKMARAAPGWALVGARCGWVGAAGGALVGGYSWLSHEFGLISDPQNLLDAQVVLKDGRVVWASEEDDGALLWALRGGGGNFGVVVGLKMRARRYHEAIFAGLVFVPYERLEEVGEWVERAVERLKDPKTAFFITNQGPGTGVPPQGAKPGIAVVLFDAYGEEHAKSKEEGFGEIFEMEGLVEISCGLVPLSGMTKLAESYKSYQGVNQFWGSAPLMEEKVDAGIIKRAWDWYAKAVEECPVLDQGSTVLFEFCQAVSRSIAVE